MGNKLHILSASADSSKVRYETFMGRDYTVVPVIALVEGVLQASNSPVPELALASEFAKVPDAWNGRPVVMNHPKDDDGVPISANIPSVLETVQFGYMFNTQLKNNAAGKPSLYTEAWIDTKRAKKLGGDIGRVLERIDEGEVIEVSTGLYSVSEESKGTWDLKDYEAIWRDVVPDHLAFLSEGKTGACSVEDGCGAMRTNAGIQQTGDSKPVDGAPSAEDVIYDEDAGFEVESIENKGDDDPDPDNDGDTDDDDNNQTKNPGGGGTMTYPDGKSPGRVLELRSNCACAGKCGQQCGQGAVTIAAKKDSKKPYGDVEYADPGYQKDGKKRYPIDTASHIKAAWDYIHMPKNAKKYSKSEVSAIKRRIIAAWKKKIDAKGPPGAKNNEAYAKARAAVHARVVANLVANAMPDGMPTSDVGMLLSQALNEVFTGNCYLITFTSDDCIFQYVEPTTWEYTTYSVPYTVDDSGKVTFSGPAVEVVLLTRIVPVADHDPGDAVTETGRPALNANEVDMTTKDPKANAGAAAGSDTTLATTTTTSAPEQRANTSASAPAPRQLTAKEYIEQAPPEVRQALEEGMRAAAARKDQLISEIKSNENNPFSEDELKAMELTQLDKLAMLRRKPSYAGAAVPMGMGRDANLRDQESATPPAPLKVFSSPEDAMKVVKEQHAAALN